MLKRRKRINKYGYNTYTEWQIFHESLQTLNNFTNTLLGVDVKQKGGELTQFGKERLAMLQQEKDLSEQGTGIITGPDSEGAKVLDTISGIAKTAVRCYR